LEGGLSVVVGHASQKKKSENLKRNRMREKLICRIFAVLLLLSCCIYGEIVNYRCKDFYPLKTPFYFAMKLGHYEQGYPGYITKAILIDGEYHFEPSFFKPLGGGYYQFHCPAGIYILPNNNAIVYDLKGQFEIGPPPTTWFPQGIFNIGVVYMTHDWISHRDNEIKSLLYGAMFRANIVNLKDSSVELKVQNSFAGDKIFRFSCGIRLFVSKHLGLHLHGENFRLTRNEQAYIQNGFFLGLMVKL
jgi:hypothetical protein